MPCTPASEIQVSTNGLRADEWSGAIIVQKVTGIINTCYNKIAVDIGTAAGNGRLAAYTDDSGMAKDLLSQTDSFVVTADYDYKDIPEFTIPSADFWLAFQLDDSNVRTKGENPGGNGFSSMTYSFGAFADPYVNTYSGTVGLNIKAKHETTASGPLLPPPIARIRL